MPEMHFACVDCRGPRLAAYVHCMLNETSIRLLSIGAWVLFTVIVVLVKWSLFTIGRLIYFLWRLGRGGGGVRVSE